MFDSHLGPGVDPDGRRPPTLGVATVLGPEKNHESHKSRRMGNKERPRTAQSFHLAAKSGNTVCLARASANQPLAVANLKGSTLFAQRRQSVNSLPDGKPIAVYSSPQENTGAEMSTDVNEQLFKQEALQEQSERVSEPRMTLIRQHCEDVIQEVVDGLRSPAEESRDRVPVRRTQSLKLRTDGLHVKGIKMEPPVEAVEEVETVGEMHQQSADVQAVADISLQEVESARMIVSDTVKEMSPEHGSLEELDEPEPNFAEQCQKWQNSAGLRLDDLDTALRTGEIVDDADEDQKTTVTEVTNDESATTEVSDGAGEIDATSELKTAAPVKTSAVIEISISASDVPKLEMTLHDGAELKQSANDRHHEEPIPMIDDISPVKAEFDGGEPSSGGGANAQRQLNGSKSGSPEALGKAARFRQRVKQGCTLV